MLIAVLVVGIAILTGLAVLWHFKKAELKVMYPRCFQMWADTSRFKIVYVTCQIVGSVSWATGVNWPVSRLATHITQ